MINLTPHTIVLRTPQGDIAVPPSGIVARVTTQETQIGMKLQMPVMERKFGRVEGLPERDKRGDGVLVSAMVLAALRDDSEGVYAPDTGATAIRENGQVVAVTQLIAA